MMTLKLYLLYSSFPGKGDWNLHPILPAVIETSKRRGYHDDLFHSFFRSMRMDEEVNRCMRETDTFNYMEGRNVFHSYFLYYLGLQMTRSVFYKHNLSKSEQVSDKVLNPHPYVNEYP